MPKTGLPASAALLVGIVAYPAAQAIGPGDLRDGLANPSRWLVHSGDYTSRRHSPLTQITPGNVGDLVTLWTFQTGVVAGGNQINKFEATPIAIDGMLYVTGMHNHAWAIDGRTGKQVWRYQRKLPPGLKVCCGPGNRGFAVHGDRLFMTTLDAHVVALDIRTGTPVWDVELADHTLGHASTVAPRAIDPETLERKWEVPYGGPSYSGVLSTASGLVFAGDHDGTLMAVESRSGRLLWRYRLGAPFYAAPSTVTIDGRQILLMPAGTTLTAFGLRLRHPTSGEN